MKSNFEGYFKSHFSNADSPRGTQIHSSNYPTGKTKQVPLENFFLQSSSENHTFQEEYQNSQDENDIDVNIVKGTKYSTMNSAKCGIFESITETTNSEE